MFFITVTHADVYKCKLASGKIYYQSSPCPSSLTEHQKIINIKELSEQQRFEAQERLKIWQAQQAVEEAAKLKAARQLQEEQVKRDTIDALNRDAFARQQEAIAAERQAEALERQRNQNPSSIFARPPPDH
jgi:hypothetical protein